MRNGPPTKSILSVGASSGQLLSDSVSKAEVAKANAGGGATNATLALHGARMQVVTIFLDFFEHIRIDLFFFSQNPRHRLKSY